MPRRVKEKTEQALSGNTKNNFHMPLKLSKCCNLWAPKLQKCCNPTSGPKNCQNAAIVAPRHCKNPDISGPGSADMLQSDFRGHRKCSYAQKFLYQIL